MSGSDASIDAGSMTVPSGLQLADGNARRLLAVEPVRGFLDRLQIGTGGISAARIGGGHSNVTLEIARDDIRVVLRRPPHGPLPPGAHDVVREARIQERLYRAGIPVPRVLAICEDESVNGAPFYVMEYLDGSVLGASLPPGFASHRARGAAGEALVDHLVALHNLDVRAASLSDFGRETGYLERQVFRFGSIWRRTRTRALPDVDRIAVWLAERIPSTPRVCFVHGDYRIGNVMFARDGTGRLQAILDWEMATVGDPLADLGYLVAMWAENSTADAKNPMLALSRVTMLAGFPSRAEILSRYEAMSGRSLGSVHWYEVFAMWKACVFLEASYTRHRRGDTDDPFFATLESGVPALARSAIRRMRHP